MGVEKQLWLGFPFVSMRGIHHAQCKLCDRKSAAPEHGSAPRVVVQVDFLVVAEFAW